MPWHDVGIKLQGEVVKDLLEYFEKIRRFAVTENNLHNKKF